MPRQDRAAVVREGHGPVRWQIRGGEAADPSEVERGEHDELRPAAGVRDRQPGDQLRLAAHGVDLVVPRRERLGAHRAIEPGAVHHVDGAREGDGATDDLAAGRRDAEGGQVRELSKEARVPEPARRRIAGARLRLRRQRHQQPARLAEPLLVRPDQAPCEAERGIASLPGGLAALAAVQEENEAKGREGGQDNEGHQAVSEARESRRRHVSPPGLSFLYHGPVPGTI
jgi:hypothetical protein